MDGGGVFVGITCYWHPDICKLGFPCLHLTFVVFFYSSSFYSIDITLEKEKEKEKERLATRE